MPTKPWAYIVSVLLKSEDCKNSSSFTGTHITHAKDFLPVSLQTKHYLNVSQKFLLKREKKNTLTCIPNLFSFNSCTESIS